MSFEHQANTDLLPKLADAPAPTLADQLGVTDGEFTVIRSNGNNEKGWTVTKIDTDHSGKEFVKIEKPDEESSLILSKEIPTSWLLGWQKSNQTQNYESQEKQNDRQLPVFIGSSIVIHELEIPSKNPRLIEIFKPILSESEMPATTLSNYDHLFEKEDKVYEENQQNFINESARQQLERLRYAKINEESRDAAAFRLTNARQTDQNINHIINRYTSSENINDPKQIVEMIRTNSDLRYDLGKYLLEEKLPSRIHKMPKRIIDNSGKNPNHQGYQHLRNLSSREYTILVALSMIDGSYQNPAKGDEIHKDNDGNITTGQHRAAAAELLS